MFFPCFRFRSFWPLDTERLDRLNASYTAFGQAYDGVSIIAGRFLMELENPQTPKPSDTSINNRRFRRNRTFFPIHFHVAAAASRNSALNTGDLGYKTAPEPDDRKTRQTESPFERVRLINIKFDRTNIMQNGRRSNLIPRP